MVWLILRIWLLLRRRICKLTSAVSLSIRVIRLRPGMDHPLSIASTGIGILVQQTGISPKIIAEIQFLIEHVRSVEQNKGK